MIRKILGVLTILPPFVVMTYLMIKDVGWRKRLLVLLLVAGFVLCIGLGCSLLFARL